MFGVVQASARPGRARVGRVDRRGGGGRGRGAQQGRQCRGEQPQQGPQAGLAVCEEGGGQQRRPQVSGEHAGREAQGAEGVGEHSRGVARRGGVCGVPCGGGGGGRAQELEGEVQADLRRGQHGEDLAEAALAAGEPGQ